MTSQEVLSGALLDVRKAYRLLYFFQERALDLLEQLSRKLGQEFYRWLPSGDETAIQVRGNPAEWGAWTMLPLFDASLLYLPSGVDANDKPRQGQWLLELVICPDDDGEEHENPNDFRDARESRSMIYLYGFVVTKYLRGRRWWDVYQSVEWPETDRVVEANEDGVSLVALSTNLASLPDAAAIDSLAKEFRDLVRKQGGTVKPSAAAGSVGS
jgi:hypothetical protein